MKIIFTDKRNTPIEECDSSQIICPKVGEDVFVKSGNSRGLVKVLSVQHFIKRNEIRVCLSIDNSTASVFWELS